MQGSSATVWCDSIATATVPMQFLPRLTAGGEQSEVTLVGAPTRYVIEVVSDHEALAPGTYAVNDYGKTVRNVRALRGCTLHVRQAADVWVPSVDSLIVNASINLAHEDAWLITPHWMPSEAIANLLPKVWVDGKRATNGSNVRVAIYLDGAVLVPRTEIGVTVNGTYCGGDVKMLGAIWNERKGVACAHDIRDLENERTADRARGMVPRVLRERELPRVDHHHRERIAHRQGRRHRIGRRHAEGTRLLPARDREVDVGELRER